MAGFFGRAVILGATLLGLGGAIAWTPHAEATGLARKHGLPDGQATDVFGIEPGMTVVEVRKILAAQFPTAFSGCSHLLETAGKLLCRLTSQAYYEEITGRPLNPAAQSADAAYISNLVLTVEEGGIKRSIEVFFGSGISGREAYRVTGTTRYAENAQPKIADYQREFVRKFGPLTSGQARGAGSVARAVFINGARLTDGEADEAALDCVEMAKAATSAHDVRAMGSHVVSRYLARPPCDVMIGLAMAQGPMPGSLGAVTVVVFDAARMGKVYQMEAQRLAAIPRAPAPVGR